MHRWPLICRLPIPTLAVALLLAAGCKKPSATQPPASATTSQAALATSQLTDPQITAQIERQIASENALASLPIQVESASGVVTLSGNVNNDATRNLAAADAAEVPGVKTVVNNLVVTPAPVAQPAAVAQRAPHHIAPKHNAPQLDTPKHEQARNSPPIPPPAPIQPPAQTAPPIPATVKVQPIAPAPVAPPPPPQPVQELLTLPAGTDIPVRLTETLETGITKSDTRFHGVLSSDLMVAGVVAIPHGSDILGRVIEAKDAAHFKGKAELSLELTQITAQGNPTALITQPLLQLGPARGKNTTEKAIGGALFGTLIGALAGGGRGALIGGAAGAGTGAGANAITRGEQVKLPAESLLHFKLKNSIQVKVWVPASGSPPHASGSNSSSSSLLQRN